MVTICIVLGLVLGALGIIIACTTKNGHKEKSVNEPPPLPPRVNVGIHSPRVSHPPTRTSSSSITRALPSRRTSTSSTSNTVRITMETNSGPRGIKPTQFPCCPFDKQRNVAGQRQVIFWDSAENCYRCSRGHQFKSNGKLL